MSAVWCLEYNTNFQCKDSDKNTSAFKMATYHLFSNLAFVLLVCLLRENESGIICHCDFCTGSVPNNTCHTDGYCLSLTWLRSETSVIHHAYRCLDRRMYFPRQIPTQCSISSSRNVAVVTACCNTDMCNLHLRPTLPLNESTDELPAIDELAFASLARDRHKTTTTSTPPPDT